MLPVLSNVLENIICKFTQSRPRTANKKENGKELKSFLVRRCQLHTNFRNYPNELSNEIRYKQQCS